MAFQRGGRSGGNRGGGGQAKYIRVGNMFESDEEYRPEKSTRQFSTKLDGKYLDAVRECLNDNDAVRFTFTYWRGGDYPVLAVAPVEGGSRGRSRSRTDDSRGSHRSPRGDYRRDVRSRSIEAEPEDVEDAGDDLAEVPEDNNWEK